MLWEKVTWRKAPTLSSQPVSGGPQLSNGENLLGGGREAVADRASPPYGEQQVCLAGPA